jgi:hypothetical protein
MVEENEMIVVTPMSQIVLNVQNCCERVRCVVFVISDENVTVMLNALEETPIWQLKLLKTFFVEEEIKNCVFVDEPCDEILSRMCLCSIRETIRGEWSREKRTAIAMELAPAYSMNVHVEAESVESFGAEGEDLIDVETALERVGDSKFVDFGVRFVLRSRLAFAIEMTVKSETMVEIVETRGLRLELALDKDFAVHLDRMTWSVIAVRAGRMTRFGSVVLLLRKTELGFEAVLAVVETDLRKSG